ncbi:helix-turn-helix transcriptional regulator [Kordiimonas gwangyangensis]|uniref:helix-turn-helix transcriptional regulator n=1 Tax=Kordiimonas gwangyangensis TaxID=288022 RepID=UPI0004713EC1|nr:YafY family protein [Kordiimonas gwangyangensis]
MRRADRLFQIVSYLQGRRMAITAQDIADEFDISVRTVYRDIQDLITTGVPISGEAGVGYILDKSYYLPPMSLDMDELEALMLGAAMVSSWTDGAMGASAKSLILKIKNVLSAEDREAFSGTALFAPPSRAKLPWTIDFSFLRHAVRQKHKLALDYADEEGRATLRVVRPLSLVFIGPVWMMLAWCEMRKDFRHFRLDRMRRATPTGDVFIDTPETSLKCYLDRMNYCDGLKD